MVDGKIKKWVAVASMAVVGLAKVPFTQGILPTFITQRTIIAGYTVVDIAAVALLVSAYWVLTLQTN